MHTEKVNTVLISCPYDCGSRGILQEFLAFIQIIMRQPFKT